MQAGWSDPALATLPGRLAVDALRLPEAVAGRLGLPTLRGALLGRHRVLDALLTDAIHEGRVGQVIELAAGLSPRGLTFTRRFPDLAYVEADLPRMAATKRRLLRRAGPLAAGHRVLSVDAFADEGPASLAGIAAELDPGEGTAIITEGLLNYFPTPSVVDLWRRIAEVLVEHRSGLYLADVGLRPARGGPLVDAFLDGLQVVVRGRVSLHFADEDEASDQLRSCGFATADVRPIAGWPAASPWMADPGTRLLDVLAATTG